MVDRRPAPRGRGRSARTGRRPARRARAARASPRSVRPAGAPPVPGAGCPGAGGARAPRDRPSRARPDRARSASPPCASGRAAGSPASRPAMATTQPSGRWAMSSARASRQSRSRIRCASSMTTRTGGVVAASAARSRPTMARGDTEGDAIAANNAGSSGREPIQRSREVRQQRHRVVVAVVGRQPGHGPARPMPPTGPARGSCRTPAARRWTRAAGRERPGSAGARGCAGPSPRGAAGR